MTVKRWLGNAASVTDVWTILLSGTVVSQTYTLTMNGKSISYIATSSDTVSTILAALISLWKTPTNPPEFLELTAVGFPSVGPFSSVTISQKSPGVPSAISIATSGAATVSVTNTIAATGPNFFDNGQNWSGGVSPANSDTLVFDNGSIGCNYNVNSTLTGVMLNISPGFSGTIGLPAINASGSTTYAEYRTTNLTLAGGTAIINCPTIQQCNLAFGSHTATVRVLATGQRLNAYTPVLMITGGNGSSELDVSKGDVALAFYQGTTATFPIINVGYISNALTDVTLLCGSGCTLTTITKNGGNAIISANATTITQGVNGGVVTLADSVTVTTLNILAGTVNINSVGTIGTINLYGTAIMTADGDPRAKTLTNPINVYSAAVTVIDNQKSINSGILSLALNGNPSANVSHGGASAWVLT